MSNKHDEVLNIHLAKHCLKGDLPNLSKFLEKNGEPKWISGGFDFSIKAGRMDIARWLILEKRIEPDGISRGSLRRLVDKKSWDIVELLLGESGLDVNTYDGYLLRRTFFLDDFEGARFLLEKFKADLRFLDCRSLGVVSQYGADPRWIDLLVTRGDSGENGISREEVLHMVMMETLLCGQIDIGISLADQYGLDVNAHEGIYPRLAMVKSINAGKWMKEFFARGLKPENLRSLPLEAFLSDDISLPSLLLFAGHLAYDQFSDQIENAREFRRWDLNRDRDFLLFKAEEDCKFPKDLDAVLAAKREDFALFAFFCRFWRTYDRLNYQKADLEPTWKFLKNKIYAKIEITDEGMEDLLKSRFQKTFRGVL